MITATDIGDIRLELQREDTTETYSVSVHHIKNGGKLLLEEFDYSDREQALNKYSKLNLLLRKIAGIHSFHDFTRK